MMTEPAATPEPLTIDIRPASQNDVAWIYSSWLKSYYEHGSNTNSIPPWVYQKHHRAIIQRVTSKPGVNTLVACPAQNEDQILGWLCAEHDRPLGQFTAHFGHVKSEYRRQGIMKALVAAFGIDGETKVHSYTHHTKVAWYDPSLQKTCSIPLAKLVPQYWQFNPYLFTAAN